MNNKFQSFQRDSSSSYNFFVVTPNDSTDMESDVRGLYIGVGGDVVVRNYDNNADITFKNCYSGQVLPIRCIKVKATGTTATNIVGLV